ncbi:MAG: ABC transporter ATP-binding protein [Novibacillus thermophilus]|uniref:ABC transporter n=1 Tax=Novibacillus thermophilus TaxID=1471761 RepID=A0A1U9K3R0_9BACL|nr:ABC transporter ATP-binding protein [Novibacillus thermophilus]AQS54679.1 ABC transporter [Novibacillus thermophilus]
MIRVRHISKRYRDTVAVDDVSLDVREGEVFGLLGPNGAGKTTTMEMVEGLRPPDTGEIVIDGLDVVRERQRVKKVIGIQLQATALFERLTVREMLRLYASFYGETQPTQDILSRFHLEEKAEDWVKHLSGGQKQRLAIGLAVIHDPKVLFLDEPTTGLDPQARRGLWDIIHTLQQSGKTIVLSTHYMEEAEALCDRIAIMDAGKVIALDTPSGLIRRLDSDSVVEFVVPDGLDVSRFQSLAGVKRVKKVDDGKGVQLLTDALQQTLKELIDLSEHGTFKINGLRTRTATLEDVFLHLTGKRLKD